MEKCPVNDIRGGRLICVLSVRAAEIPPQTPQRQSSAGSRQTAGLFVPERFPSLKDSLAELAAMDYPHRAALVLSAFLEEYDGEKLLGGMPEGIRSV